MACTVQTQGSSVLRAWQHQRGAECQVLRLPHAGCAQFGAGEPIVG